MPPPVHNDEWSDLSLTLAIGFLMLVGYHLASFLYYLVDVLHNL